MKRIVARFYEEETGRKPVRDWLLGLNTVDRKAVGQDIAVVEFGWPIGMPTCKPIRDGVLEVRSAIKSGKVEARTYFGIDGDMMILLHGHEGKTGQDNEIIPAVKRWRDYQNRKRAKGAQAKKAGKK